MMGAIILDTPMPDRHLTQPDEAISPSTKQLSSSDRDYYRRRATDEADAATKASCGEARIAHEQLATAYRRLCSSHGAHVDPGSSLFFH
jgi:hypothetical protein